MGNKVVQIDENKSILFVDVTKCKFIWLKRT